MGLVTETNSLVIRGSAVAPASLLSGKHLATVEILRDRRQLFSEEQTIAISAYVSNEMGKGYIADKIGKECKCAILKVVVLLTNRRLLIYTTFCNYF